MAARDSASVAAFLMRKATLAPSEPVVVAPDGSLLLDGTMLLAGTNAALGGLDGFEVVSSDRVVVEMEATVETIVIGIAVLAAGCVLIPVRPGITEEELATIVTDARPTLAVTTRASAVVRSCRPGELTGCDQGATREPKRVEADTDALIVYTSGTTGNPKGVVLSHGAIAAGVTMLHDAWGWSPDDRLIVALPLFHVHGLVAALFGALAIGATVILAERFSVATVTHSITDARATMFFGVPTMYHAIDAAGQHRVLRELRLAVSGSAPLDVLLFERFEAHGVFILERYGMTETLLSVSNPLNGRRLAGTVGVPLPGVTVRLGDDGELLVATPACFSRYLNQHEATAEVLVDGWVHTGDLAAIDEGVVTIVGRKKELIITGGFNVLPSEVEAVLARHSSVNEVGVAGRPDPKWGEVVEAWVVPTSSQPLDKEALLAFAGAHLPPHKCPRAVHVVKALPRTALGKIQRSALGRVGG